MGTITGIGIGMVYLPTVFSTTVYFNKYRGIACSLALSGCGVGIFLLSPLLEHLLQEYGLTGTLLINSGIMLNCIPCCLIYRTLAIREAKTPSGEDGEDMSVKYINSNQCGLSHSCEFVRSIEKGLDENSKEQMTALLNVNNYERDAKESDKVQADVIITSKESRNEAVHIDRNSDFKNDVDKKVESKNRTSTNMSTEAINRLKEREHETIALSSDKVGHKTEHSIDNDIQVEFKNSRPLTKQDSTMTRYTTLLKSRQVLLFLISQFLFVSNCYVPYIFIPDKAKVHGIKESNSAWIASAFGLGSIFGRIVLGFVADRPCVNKKTMFMCVMMLSGLSTVLCPWLNTFWTLLVYAVTYGTVMGTTVSLISVVLLDTVGTRSLPDAMGLNYLISGLGGLLGAPFVGLLHDLTDSYTAPFLFAGGAMVTAGMLVYGV